MKLFIVWFVVLFAANGSEALATSSFQSPSMQRQFDDRFQDRYTGRKYNYEGTEVVNANLSPVSGKGSKYEQVDPNVKEENIGHQSTFSLKFLNYLFIATLVAAVLYLVYILFNEGGSGLFSTRGHQKLNAHDAITSETIDSTDMDALIKKAESDHDFRLAVRLYYLLVLKTLSLKKLIRFEVDKTDAEYLNEIANQKFSGHFAHTSYLYNYVWYGEFILDHAQYQIAKQRFTLLLDDMK